VSPPPVGPYPWFGLTPAAEITASRPNNELREGARLSSSGRINWRPKAENCPSTRSSVLTLEPPAAAAC
jgi:hypothetical protein